MRNRLTFFALLPAFIAGAQISDGGKPLLFLPETQAVLSAQTPATIVLPALDVQKAREEDTRNPGQNRFAAPVAADISFETAGSWTELPGVGRVWQCELRSPGALGLVLLFDEFQLPSGGRFFAFSPDGQRTYGAYTERSCIPSGKFTIGILPGETARLEYFEPAAVKGLAKMHLYRVDVAYDRVAMQEGEVAGLLGFGDALPCNVNINCPAGAAWQMEKKGVARILMIFDGDVMGQGAGAGWCSGSLIANTSGSGEPYLLSAHHCQLIGLNPDFDLWRFDFDYEAAACNNPPTPPASKSILGCERISYRAETDFMLLKINPLPNNYGLYFNGWTREITPPAFTTFIHHPIGDIKKISVDSGASVIQTTTLNWGGVFGISPANSHWKVTPDIGIFQPGSSGSPLFNPNKLIVGQLHGGAIDTGNQCIIYSAYFGRYDLSWNQGSDSGARLRDWLDPNNENPVSLSGYPQPVPQVYAISGNIKTHNGVAMQNLKVKITGSASATVYTDTLGNYSFANIPVGGNYTITPERDSNDLNGVSTFDLVLISKHILASELFDSTCKIIASNDNKSTSVTTFDIVEIRKVILGINNAFPNNTSWRFFPAITAFSNPSNPFMTPLPPESIVISNLQGDYSGADFTAAKTGDVNNTVDPKY
ncbi:MAG: hypothetical protein IPJ82_07925 [Lewinellaceae bacterium]|nr:hypothetical protein [Lewinellaceae bacterium]